ncbi:MAG: DUF4398 domain-containing protein [Vicinamibacterales bacterium]
MDQAQGAIDAARAVGADRYAAAEFTSATDALTRARQAVTERDYRLALSDALDSREHAQNAAREAADTRARLRGEVERLTTEVSLLLEQVEKVLAAAEKSRAPRHTLRQHRDSVTAATTSLQEARTAVAAGDYTAATNTLTGTKDRIAAVITAIDTLTAAQTPRRRR